MDPATGRFYREALESFADDSAHVDFAACAVRFTNEHWIEGESSAFETAVQTTVGIGVGLFRLAFGGVVFLFVMGVVGVGCLMLVS